MRRGTLSRLLMRCGESVLRTSLIRPCRTCVRWGTFPKGEGQSAGSYPADQPGHAPGSNRRDQPKSRCHCEPQRGVAISWYSFNNCTAVAGDCHVARLPRNDRGGRYLSAINLPTPVIDTGSAGWCSAQRIRNPMIASGNHTLIQMTPPYNTNYLMEVTSKWTIKSQSSLPRPTSP